MHRFRLPALAALACLVGGSPLSAQDAATTALVQAAERYEAIVGLCADFEQHLEVPLLNEERTSRGRLCQMRPNLFRMDFTEPDGDRVVADGAHFWIFYPSLNPGQVIRLPLDPARGGLDFYREFLEEPVAKYEISDEGVERVGDTRTLRVKLEPREPRGYRGATVWIDPDTRLIRRVEVVEENGTVRRITLTGVELDPDLSAADFAFRVPAGVQVISG